VTDLAYIWADATTRDLELFRKEQWLEHAQSFAELLIDEHDEHARKWDFARGTGLDPEKLAGPIAYERGTWERE
jgi:hypothetical protein